MRCFLPIIMLLLLVPAQSVLAAGEMADSRNMQIILAPQVLQFSGYTQYEMDYRGWFDGEPVVVGSRLEFPVDVAMAGCRVRLRMTTKGGNVWWLQGGLFASLDDPEKVMKDTDWMNVTRYRVIDVSYTESPAKMKSVLLTLEGGRRLFSWKHLDLSVCVGLRYQHIHQDINGWNGWYLDTNLVRQEQSGTTHGMVYKVTHIQPHAGVLAEVAPDRDISLELKAAYAPVKTSDYDDHVLRKKIAEASLTGHGFISGARIRWCLSKGSGLRPILELTGDYLYLHASGDQVQHWYGDDPATPYDDTQLEISGIPHEISSRQASFGVSLGLAF